MIQRLSGKPDVLPEIILPAEQTALVAYYSVMLKKFCAGKEFRFPDAVRAAAMAYFWRFYLYESVMSYSPKDVLSVCFGKRVTRRLTQPPSTQAHVGTLGLENRKLSNRN